MFCSTWLIESSKARSVEEPSLSGASVMEPELDLRIRYEGLEVTDGLEDVEVEEK